MAGKFGTDFNAAQPSDADLVKKGAQWIRDIKTRIKSFMAVCFNLETGQLKENVVAYTSLKTLNPSPAGQYRLVQVNEKGLVVQGSNPADPVVSIRRQLYSTSAGVDADGNSITGSLTTDTDGNEVMSFSFTVSEGVDRLLIRAWGAGGGGGYNSTPATAGGGGGGGYVETNVEVTEGDVFLIWVGVGGTAMTSGGTAGKKGGLTKVDFSGNRIEARPGEPGTSTAGGAAGAGQAFGLGNAVGFTGHAGTTAGGGLGGSGGSEVSMGGAPASSGAGGANGKSGYVVIEYVQTV